jgi:FkbM family methyltransferase
MDKFKDNFLELYQVAGFQLYCIKNDVTITKMAKEYNKIWEDWVEDIIKELYIENTNMVDIGAHIGTCSLIMSKYISENCFIYAFEPVYDKITNLNICENNLEDKIKLFPLGLSDKKCQDKYENNKNILIQPINIPISKLVKDYEITPDIVTQLTKYYDASKSLVEIATNIPLAQRCELLRWVPNFLDNNLEILFWPHFFRQILLKFLSRYSA